MNWKGSSARIPRDSARLHRSSNSLNVNNSALSPHALRRDFISYLAKSPHSFDPEIRILVTVCNCNDEYFVFADRVSDVIGKCFAVHSTISFGSKAWQFRIYLDPTEDFFDLSFQPNTKSGGDILVILDCTCQFFLGFLKNLNFHPGKRESNSARTCSASL